MYHNTKEQLKKLKNTNSRINPDRSWVLENKEKMMCQIGNSTTNEKNTFSFTYIWDMINVIVPGQMVYSVVRPVLVFLLIGAVATSGWIASVGATANSLPGDIGYGVKMATEKTQQIVASMTSSDQKEAELHLEFATRRAKEVKKIVEKKDEEISKEETSKNVGIAIEHLEKSIDSANDKLKKVTENQPEKVVEASKVVAEKTKEIKDDLRDAENASRIIEKAVKEFGEINILINCAGVHKTTPYKNFSFDEYSKVTDVNQNVIVFLSVEASNQFIAQGKGGKIINVGSMAGLVPPPGHLAYCTSKQAISGITMAMAVDLAKKKININAIAPGFVLTKMLSNAADEETLARVAKKIPAGRLGLPEDFKGIALFLASDASDFVNGQTFLVDGAHANSLNL